MVRIRPSAAPCHSVTKVAVRSSVVPPISWAGAEPEDAPGQQRLQAGLFHHPGDLVHPEVVVGEGHRAAADHLAGGQRRTPVDVFLGQRALGHPDPLVEPAVQRQVLGPTALEESWRRGCGR